MAKVYVADFETTTNEFDCRVWGWGLYNIEKDKFGYGKDIESFFNRVKKLPNKSKIYFHNLKFDGEFLFHFLFKKGFEHTREKKLKNKQFSTLISDMMQFYQIQVMTGDKTFKFLDSLKVLPLRVSQISKAFGLEQLKGEIDYTLERPIGWELTEEEIAYLKNDVEIVGKALQQLFNEKLTRMTTAGNAFSSFESTFSRKEFDYFFPKLYDLDTEIRKSYKGGFTYANEKFQNKDIKECGIVVDINSLYPSVMYNEKLPYGTPKEFEGKYRHDKLYNVYIQKIKCHFELRDNHIPTIQIKNTLGFKNTEYVKNNKGYDVEMYLTSVDLKLFFKHYKVVNIEWLGGWKFKSSNKLFRTYIDKWAEVKRQASVENNAGKRTLAKLMLNSLYGRFALNPDVQSKIPVYVDGEIDYKLTDKEEREPVYIPVASFITAYSRKQTITSAQQNYENFLYADTDSMHIKGKDIKGIEIHETKLGAWKIEYEFTKGRYLRAKSYIEVLPDGELYICCAGMPTSCYKNVTFENFKAGLSVGGKLKPKRVSGGVILENIDFTIKL